MKSTLGICTTTIMFLGSFGLAGAYAAPSETGSHRSPVEITGCLQQGPTAKEYLLQASDGTTWGINETDMLMNGYVGRTVTVAGDATHPNASERTAGGAHRYLMARDIVVENETCQK
jgi:hypothetical protein